MLTAVEDLKQQFAEMERHDLKPKQFGLMVREAPDTLETTLLITARNKMKDTEVIQYQLNYGGVYADTSKLSRDPKINTYNLEQVKEFMQGVTFDWIKDRYMAKNVSRFEVAKLIRALKIPYVNKKFDTEGLSEYIENSHLFPIWDVVIATGRSGIYFMDIENVNEVERSFHIKSKSDQYIRIGGSNNRVMDPNLLNAGLWLTEDQKVIILKEKRAAAKGGEEYKNLSALDYLERRTCPILIIYPIKLKKNEDAGQPAETLTEMEKICKDFQEPLMAFAFGFPKKESGERLNYRANRVKLDELVGKIEVDDEEEEGFEDDEE